MKQITKPQIPLEDRVLIEGLMEKVWMHDDIKALTEVTTIISKYSKKGYDTTNYALELLQYSATKNQIVLHESLN